MADAGIIALMILVIIAAIAIMTTGIKIIRPYEQGIYMSLGRFVKLLDPGFNMVRPLINEVIKIDLRTQVMDVPRQEVITKDNSPTNVDALLSVQVTDPTQGS